MAQIGVETLRAEVARLEELGIHPGDLAQFAHADGLAADAEESREDGCGDGWDEWSELEEQYDAELADPAEMACGHFDGVREALALIQAAR